MDGFKMTPKRKEIFELMNFNSIFDLLTYFPYRFDHLKNEKLNYSLHNQKVTFEGTITSKVKIDHISNGKKKTTFTLSNNDNEVKVVMFNKFVNSSFLHLGVNLVISGKYNAFVNEIAVSSFFVGSLNGQEKFIPIYSLPSTVKDVTYRNFIESVFQYAKENNYLIDKIPADFINKYKLISYDKAIEYIHNPKSEEQLKQAYRYLKYEEFLTFCTIGLLKRKMYSSFYKTQKKEVDIQYVKEFIYSLPFKLTVDQKYVVKDILNDISSNYTMSRLIQGDVGSGKTIVSIIALIANYTTSFQGALMAPTDILARQHYKEITSLLKYSSIRVSLLVSDMKDSEKKEVLENLKNGLIDIVVGTHSLIQNNVIFNKLGLVVIDEQHRFGVKQRVALKEKGTEIDVLYMSATPIPRTLASTIYMDMDVSTIECYPYKERIINTKYIAENTIKSVKNEIEEYLKTNQKIYIVCPAIEESSLEISNVYDIYNKISKEFKNYKVALLHGKMNAIEKESIMNRFDSGEYQILVSTTVIEVGINIIDANMMIIYNAERFGLAQIHQLRGRIARDGKVGYCYLLSDHDDEDVIERLNFISQNNNGFKISEYDLKRRGAGDMLGLAQSGKSPFKVANLIEDFNILQAASKDAQEILTLKEKYNDFLEYVRKIIHNNEQYVD